jgi:hypothetical protein
VPRGDVNRDGLIDTLDPPALISELFAEVPEAQADVNEDEGVSAADIGALIELL